LSFCFPVLLLLFIFITVQGLNETFFMEFPVKYKCTNVFEKVKDAHTAYLSFELVLLW